MTPEKNANYQLDPEILLHEQMHSSISNYLGVTAAILVGTIELYIVLNLLGNVNPIHLHAWVAFQLILCCIWPVLYYRYHNNYEPIKAIWSTWIEIPLSLLAGLGWGMMWVLFIEPDNVINTFLLNGAICVFIVGAVISTPIHRPAMNASILGCVAPILVTAPLREGDIYILIMIGISILGSISYAFGLVFNQVYTQAFVQREQNKALAENLALEKQQVERASAEKTRFLAAASHDLRQPIQAMRLFEAVLEPMLTNHEQLTVLKKISEANGSLAGLLEGLLDISRLDSGIVHAEPEVVALQDLFASLYMQLDDMAYSQQIELRYVSTHHQIFIDKQLLERVLRNLLVNAIKHMGKSGKILFGVRHRVAGGLCIEVLDNGVGIAEAEQARIFDEFYQLNNPARNREKGLGLGLSIVKRLCLLMSCELKLYSQIGHGCRFSIELPRQATAIPSQASDIQSVPQTNNALFEHHHHYHALILEDDATVAQALSLLLKQWGYSSNIANNSQGALVQLTKCPDFILSDYQLAEETGVAAIKIISQHFATTIPSLLITGSTDPNTLQILANQQWTVLHKPIEADVLRQALGQLTQAPMPITNAALA